jgi:hypothetical protein
MFDCYASLVLIVVGLGICLVIIFLSFSWWRMKSWMRLPSRVTGASIDVRRMPVAVGYVEKQYRPRIEYEYEYRGRKYLGRRMTFWDVKLWTADRAQAERQLAEPGTELRVYVSPSNPSKSIMRPVFQYRYVDLLTKVFMTGLVIGSVGVWVGQVTCF